MKYQYIKKSHSFTINTDNSLKLHHHFDMLMDNYSKLLPVRLDFHYSIVNNKRYLDAYTDMYLLYHLAKNRHHGIIGLAFSIEYSNEKRLHIHSLFYINGQKHQNYYPFFTLLQNIWNSSISYSGNVHCCHQPESYIKNALKNIDYNDCETKNYLKYVLDYIGKKEQKSEISLFYQIGTSIIASKSNSGKPRRIALMYSN